MNNAAYKCATYALLAGTLLRIIAVAGLSPHFIDFYCFTDAAQATLRGLDPFEMENLRWVSWDAAPLVYPGLTTFFIPFALTGPEVGKYLYFLLNAVAGIAACLVVVTAATGMAGLSLRHPNRKTALVFLAAFLFVNSIFFTLCIRVGQVSNFGALLLFASMLMRAKSGRVLAFAGAALAKYSNLPFWSMLYLAKGKLRFCLAAFGVFVLLSLLPALWGHNPVTLYRSYLDCLQKWMAPGGGNDFAVSGQTMLSAGFIKPRLLALLVKAGLVALFCGVLWRQRRQPTSEISNHVLLCAACVTLCVLYHRIYDGVLVYPLLLVATADALQHSNKSNAIVFGAFSLLFALPGALLDAVGRVLGRSVGENPLCYMPENMLPVVPILFFFLTLYTLIVGLRATLGSTYTTPDESRARQ